MDAKKILITGVSGLVGSAIYLYLKRWPDKYELYGMGRRKVNSDRVFDSREIDIPAERYTVGDIADMSIVKDAVEGMDVVVHMAADPAGRGWESLRDNNLIGAYNVFEASLEAGVKRVVAASTIQVSTGNCEVEPYRSITRKDYSGIPKPFPMVSSNTPGQPRNLYAASKVWTESLAQVYGYSHKMSSLCIRIGWVTGEDSPRDGRNDVWCSQRDIAELSRCCIEADSGLMFGIYYGMSDNKWRWVDMDDASKKVGFRPSDCAEKHGDSFI